MEVADGEGVSSRVWVGVAEGGGVSSRVEVARGEAVRVAAARETKPDGIAVGFRAASTRPLVEKIKQIPRIERILIPIGIKSARSNKG